MPPKYVSNKSFQLENEYAFDLFFYAKNHQQANRKACQIIFIHQSLLIKFLFVVISSSSSPNKMVFLSFCFERTFSYAGEFKTKPQFLHFKHISA